MKNDFLKIVTNRKQLYKASFLILLVSLITSYSVLTYLNEWFINSFGTIFLIDPKFFYSSHFNELAYATMAIIIGIFTPAFISLYGNAKSSNKISQYFIKDHFRLEEFILIAVLIISGAISKNSFFIIIILIAAFLILILKMQLYMQFLFNTKQVLIDYLKDVFNTHTQAGLIHKQTADKIELIVKQYFTTDDNIKLHDRTSYFRSKGYIETFSTIRLKDWLERVKSDLDKIYPNSNEDSQTPLLAEKFSANIIYDPNEKFLAIRINLPTDTTPELYQKWRTEHFPPLKSSFENDIFSYSSYPEEYHDLLSSLDVYIYSLLKQSNYTDFVETISFIKELVEDENMPHDNLVKLSFMNYRLFNIYNDFEKNSATSFHFFEYWKTLLERSQMFPDKEGVRFVWNDLASAIKHNIFLSNEINDLDRAITNLHNYNILSPNYFLKYLNGLLSVIVSFATENPDRQSETLKFINIIKYLRDDFSEDSYYGTTYTSEDKKEIHYLANDALVLACFFLDQEVPKLNQNLRDNIYKLIHADSLLNSVQRIYLQKEKKWDITFWRSHRFDRHGLGTTWTFSLTDMLLNGIVRFAQLHQFPTELFSTSTISSDALYLFRELKNKLGSISNSDDFKSRLNGFIERGIITEANEIIDAPLDTNRINELIQGCTNSYLKESKFSSIFASSKIDKCSPENAIGQNAYLNKDNFIKEKNVHIISLYDLGRHVAFNENNHVLDQIIKSKSTIKNSLDVFYSSTLPRLIESDQSLIFIGKPFHFYSSAFDWRTNECIANRLIIKTPQENKEDNILKLFFNKFSNDIHLLNNPHLKSNFVLSCSPKDFKIEYGYPETQHTHLTWRKDHNLFFKIIDFSREQEITKSILDKKEYKNRSNDTLTDEMSLKTKILFKLFVTPILRVSENAVFQIYEIPHPSKER